MSNNEEKKETLDVAPGVKTADYATKRGEVVLRDHDFDGIKEYDQLLPRWWLICFWLGVLGFVVYWVCYYTFGLMPSDAKSMTGRTSEIIEEREVALQKVLDELSDDIFVNQLAKDPKILAEGEKVYMKTCSTCHAADLGSHGGSAARPLNDGKWAYGNEKPMNMFKFIGTGTLPEQEGYNKVMRMPANGGQPLSAKQRAAVTAYLISKNKADFKALEK